MQRCSRVYSGHSYKSDLSVRPPHIHGPVCPPCAVQTNEVPIMTAEPWGTVRGRTVPSAAVQHSLPSCTDASCSDPSLRSCTDHSRCGHACDATGPIVPSRQRGNQTVGIIKKKQHTYKKTTHTNLAERNRNSSSNHQARALRAHIPGHTLK